MKFLVVQCVLECVPNCYMTQEMCKKAVDIYFSILMLVSNCYKILKISEKVNFKEPFMLKYCLDKCKSQEMFKEAVNTFSTNMFRIGLLRIKCLKNFMILFSLMMI